jgi:hypothetical protein
MKLYKWEWVLLKLSAKCYVPFFGTLSTCLSVLMGNSCVFYSYTLHRLVHLGGDTNDTYMFTYQHSIHAINLQGC